MIVAVVYSNIAEDRYLVFIILERFKIQGVEIRSSTPEEFKAFYLKEEKVWTTLIKEQGIKPD